MKCRRTSLVLAVALSAVTASAQHPNRHTIDSLRRALPLLTSPDKRIDCENDIGIEYWWPSMTAADTITYWANLAGQESHARRYAEGAARAEMLLGVAEVFRKHYDKAETQLRRALVDLEKVHDDFGRGWCNVWLGQALYSQDKFEQALQVDRTSAFFMTKTADWEGQGKAWAWIGMIFATLGNYDSSFYYSSKSLALRQLMSDHLCVLLTFVNMGQLYKVAGAYPEAMDYFSRGLQYASSHHIANAFVNWTYFEVVGSLYRVIDKPDSASFYLQQSIHIDSTNEMTRVSYGETLLAKKLYDSALSIFERPVQALKAGKDNWNLMRVLLDASKAYMLKGNYQMALDYARQTNDIAENAGARPFMQEVYAVLSVLYKDIHQSDSAFYFLQRFTALRDSVVNNQFLWKLSNYKKSEDFRNKASQLVLLQAESQAKEERLRADKIFTWTLSSVLLIGILGGIIIYRNLILKRRNEKLNNGRKEAELKRHVADLEMQALRAQMNPHFIFNCLSSINSFILTGQNNPASVYLTRFSRLVRMVLSNSQRSFVSIEEEVEMLGLYVEMEKLRFRDSFQYEIRFTNECDAGTVFVPPLVLQPFAENAIWHGLLHKEGSRMLTVEIEVLTGILKCYITDNGIGRGQSAKWKTENRDKKKSMGLQITSERLALLDNAGSFFEIDDLVDHSGFPAGTRVTLSIGYSQSYDPTAIKNEYR